MQFDTVQWHSRRLLPGGSSEAETHEPRFDPITQLMTNIFNMYAPKARPWDLQHEIFSGTV